MKSETAHTVDWFALLAPRDLFEIRGAFEAQKLHAITLSEERCSGNFQQLFRIANWPQNTPKRECLQYLQSAAKSLRTSILFQRPGFRGGFCSIITKSGHSHSYYLDAGAFAQGEIRKDQDFHVYDRILSRYHEQRYLSCVRFFQAHSPKSVRFLNLALPFVIPCLYILGKDKVGAPLLKWYLSEGEHRDITCHYMMQDLVARNPASARKIFLFPSFREITLYANKHAKKLQID